MDIPIEDWEQYIKQKARHLKREHKYFWRPKVRNKKSTLR